MKNSQCFVAFLPHFLQIPSALFSVIKYLSYPKVNKFTHPFHFTKLQKKNELFPSVCWYIPDRKIQSTTLCITRLAWFCKEKEITSIIGSTSGRSWAYTDLGFDKIIHVRHQQNVVVMKENRGPYPKKIKNKKIK